MARIILYSLPALAFAGPLASAAPGGGAGEWTDCEARDGEGERGPCVAIAADPGPACLPRCTAEALAPGCLAELSEHARPRELAVCAADRVDVCRDQCMRGGADSCEQDHPTAAAATAAGGRPTNGRAGPCATAADRGRRAEPWH